MTRVFGIDLGTSSCSISVIENGKPQVLPVFESRDEMPTYVSFLPDGGRLIGWDAKRESITNPENTIFTIKRLIGRPYNSTETKQELGLLPYKVVPSASGGLWVEARGRSYSPIEITSLMLGEVKRAAEVYLREPVVDAVITVPAFFGRVQRKATEAAAGLAGFRDVRMIPEPVAAAMTYGPEARGTVAVYDLGGGTFDISILEMGDGVFAVRSINGDNLLGGEDFDHALVSVLVEDIRNRYGIDVSGDSLALHRVKDASEQIKIQLDRAKIAHVDLPYLRISPEPVHVSISFERERLERVVAPLIDRTLGPCEAALRDAGVPREQLKSIILVGGMSRMPAVQNRVRQFFGRELQCHEDPSRVVALGAAIQGGVMDGVVKDTVLLDVIPRSLAVSANEGMFFRLIERNTTVPTKKSQVFVAGLGARSRDGIAVLDVSNGCVDIYEGEFERVAQADCMASIDISQLELSGSALVEVTFELGDTKLRSDHRRTLPDRFGVEIKNKDNGRSVFEWIEPLVFRSAREERSFEQTRKSPKLPSVDEAKAYAESLILAVDRVGVNGVANSKLNYARSDALKALQSRDPNELSYATEALTQVSGLVVAPTAPEKAPALDLKAARTHDCVFISYAHEDAAWLARLRVHLRPLERLGAIEIWHDKKIDAGQEWRKEIDAALARSGVAVLLVSAHFLASDFIYDHELPPILDRYSDRGIAILPIFIGPCYFERDPFLRRLQAFNDPSRPLRAMSEADAEAELARVTKVVWSRLEGGRA